MLVCAGVSPHPPMIIPKIGGDELQKVEDTVDAMQEWASFIIEHQPEVLVFITPHGVFTRSQMGYLQTPVLQGDFAAFGAREISMQAKNDLILAERIAAEAGKEGLEVLGVDLDHWYPNDPGTLDHGITVPLYYLKEAGLETDLVAFGISLLPLRQLYGFGQALGRVLDNDPRRIGIIASGDLSHRLIPGAPAGYSPRGQEFDQLIKDSLEKVDPQPLLDISSDLVEEAGECGLRPIIMLLGALKGHEVKPKIYSYEGPFGVGYLVAGFQIAEKNKSAALSPVELARKSLEYYLREGRVMDVPDSIPREMKQKSGVFVTLTKDEELRGCIGTFEAVRDNIASEIIHNAIAAGLEDPRFCPVDLDELSTIDISVDLLTPWEQVDSIEELDPKRYGIIVKSGRRTGLLLPDLEGVDTVEEQISIASQKAGISRGEEIELYRFEVIRYH